jgi:hypothetical protein
MLPRPHHDMNIKKINSTAQKTFNSSKAYEMSQGY